MGTGIHSAKNEWYWQGEICIMEKFSKQQLDIMRKAYGTLSGMNPSSPTYKKFIKFLDELPKDQLKQLANAKIKFVSILAKNRLRRESVNEAVSPRGWNMSKKFIAVLAREVKNLQKYHRQQNDEDFLEVANYMELQLKYMKKNLNESVNEKMDPEQYHKYMQYVFDTQFKTPEEKKMKKSIIKKINVAQKKKGLPVFKESVNEGQKREASNILNKFDQAYIKFSREVRDVIKMMDRSTGDKTAGKIIDKAYSKGLIPLDKLMQSWGRGQQNNPHIKESVNEAKSKTMKTIGSIIGKKQAQKISGVLVDMQTALVIMKVWNALGSSNRAKFEKLPIKQMANIAWKLIK